MTDREAFEAWAHRTYKTIHLDLSWDERLQRYRDVDTRVAFEAFQEAFKAGWQARGAQQEPVGYLSKEDFEMLLSGESIIDCINPLRDEETDVALFAAPPAQPDTVTVPREPTPRLTDAEIEAGRQEIFSVNNPFCPCDVKTMQKIVRWTEHRIAAQEKV